jgi:hypothetical protein
MTGKVQIFGPPAAGVTDIPTKQEFRTDFRPTRFDELIDEQGARLAWARAMRCPCTLPNEQTQQPDPTCEFCSGTAWRFFGPDEYTVPEAAGELDELQAAIVAQHGSAVIKGHLSGMTQQIEAYTKIGEWMMGVAQLTVRAPNILGYNDRLVDLDSQIPFSEDFVLEYEGRGSNAQPIAPRLRYPAVAVNAVFDGAGVRYRQSINFNLSPIGEFRWVAGQAPPGGTRYSIHYLCHATWRVMDYPHIMRRASVLGKKKNPNHPLGQPTALPMQTMLRLEFLP